MERIRRFFLEETAIAETVATIAMIFVISVLVGTYLQSAFTSSGTKVGTVTDKMVTHMP